LYKQFVQILHSAWMHLHPAAENFAPMSNLWQKSSSYCRKPLQRVMQAGALCATDLEAGEAPSAHLLFMYAWGCGCCCLQPGDASKETLWFRGAWCL